MLRSEICLKTHPYVLDVSVTKVVAAMMFALLVKGGCGDHSGGSHTGDTGNEFHVLVVLMAMAVLVTVVILAKKKVVVEVVAEMTVTMLAVSMWQETC